MMPQIVLLGGTANIVGSSVYVWRAATGKSRPNRMTFLLWAIAPIIATAASLSAGVTWPVVPVIVSGICPLAVFLSSFFNKNAYWELKRLDYVCGALSILALILWRVTSDPIIAIVFSILSDGLAGVPTLIKAWKYPETESGWGYIGSSFSGLTGLIAASRWDFASLAFPAYLFFMMAAISLGVYQKKLRIRSV